MRFVFVGFVGLFVLSGCVRRVECVVHGGREWRELKTEHFVIRTDLDEDEAKQAAKNFELHRQAMVWFLGPIPQTGPIAVELLSRQSELNEFTPEAAGYFVSDAYPPRMVVAGSATTGAVLPTVQAHELAHHFTHHVIGGQPAWISEGIAQFLERIAIRDDVARVGRAEATRVTRVRHRGIPLRTAKGRSRSRSQSAR